MRGKGQPLPAERPRAPSLVRGVPVLSHCALALLVLAQRALAQAALSHSVLFHAAIWHAALFQPAADHTVFLWAIP